MLPEDNTFKVVYRLPLASGPTTRDALRYFLEIINDRGGCAACQLSSQFQVGIGRRNVNPGGDQKGRQILNVRQRVKLSSTAQTDCGSPHQKERNIAAKLGGELHQFFKRDPFA